MTLHLIDANVLLTAQNLYYGLEAVPEFWHWMLHQAREGVVKIPAECYDEIKEGTNEHGRDLLFDWVRTAEVKSAIVLDEGVDQALVQQVVSRGCSRPERY